MNNTSKADDFDQINSNIEALRYTFQNQFIDIGEATVEDSADRAGQDNLKLSEKDLNEMINLENQITGPVIKEETE